MTLKDLRRARDMTQAHLARQLGRSQVTVAQIEKRTNLLLSTLRRYVEAMGGAGLTWWRSFRIRTR